MRLHTDKDIEELIDTHYAFIKPEYVKLTRIQKADLGRYIILYHYGGFYMDLDVECKQPMSKWIEQYKEEVYQFVHPQASPTNDIHLILGFVAPPNKFGILTFAAKYTLTQWTMAAVAKHPAIWSVIKHCHANIKSKSIEYLRTGDLFWKTLAIAGPGAWSAALIEYLKQTYDARLDTYDPPLGDDGNAARLQLIGGVMVLPFRAFGESVDRMTHPSQAHVCALVGFFTNQMIYPFDASSNLFLLNPGIASAGSSSVPAHVVGQPPRRSVRLSFASIVMAH